MSIIKKNNTLPVLLQIETKECGIACLSMILGYYGKKTSMHSLRNNVPIIQDSGITLYDLSLLAKELNLKPNILKGDFEDLDKSYLPTIAFWENNHYVVIAKISNQKVIIHDPAYGKREYSYQEAKEKFSGYILDVKPDEQFYQVDNEDNGLNNNPITIMTLFNSLSKNKKNQLHLLLFSILSIIIMMAIPSYIQFNVDEAIKNSNVNLVYLLFLLFMVIFLFDIIFKYLKEKIKIIIKNLGYDELSENMRNKIIQLEQKYFHNRQIGNILAIDKSIYACIEYISDGFINIIINVGLTLFSLTFMIIYDVKLALVTITISLFFIVSRVILYKPYQIAVDNSIQQNAHYESLLIEMQQGMQTLKANNMEDNFNHIVDDRAKKYINTLNKKESLVNKFDSFSLSISSLEQLVVVSYGSLLVIYGDMTVGMLYAFMMYKTYFTDALSNIASNLLHKSSLKGPLDRIEDMLYSPEDCADHQDNDISQPVEIIKLNNISFSYPGKPELLKNINITFHRQQETVLVGYSGSGKTTILRLLTGLLTDYSGEILINETPFHEYSIKSIRKKIKLIEANDILFTGTLAANITGFAKDYTLEKIRVAARLAEIDDKIMSLPHGYQTEYQPESKFFSAGELQRLIIARALYELPDFLLCDEITANLDGETAKKVLANLKGLGIGLIFITHSIELFDDSGYKFRLDNGQLIAMNK